MKTSQAKAPLEGVWVVDMTEVWAGPMTGSLLGDLGASVIKLESFPRPSLTRLKGLSIGYSGNDPNSPRPWDRAALHNMANRNKFGITLNIKQQQGMDIFKKLIDKVDVVIISFTAGTAARLGVDYPSVSKMNPNVVMLSMSGWGEEGPYKGYAALGSALDGFTGHHALRGYRDTDDSTTPIVQHTDATASVSAVFAILVALYHRKKTGMGQWIDMSQVENFLPHLGKPFMDYVMNLRTHRRLGSRHPYLAPYGCYPCLGTDNWVVINITSQEEWLNFCKATGHNQWAVDPRYADAANRHRNHDSLDEAIQTWTMQRDKLEVMQTLQEAGVPTQAVLDDADLYENPHLKARGFFKTLQHPAAGTHRYPGFLWDLTKVNHPSPRPPNTLGEHNDYIYGDFLGISAEELSSLRAQGIIGEEYPAEVYDKA